MNHRTLKKSSVSIYDFYTFNKDIQYYNNKKLDYLHVCGEIAVLKMNCLSFYASTIKFETSGISFFN